MQALAEISLDELQAPNGKVLLRDLKIKIKPNTITAIAGPNGIGKSTLLRVLMGWHSAYRGQRQLSVKEDDISYLPQMGQWQFYLPLTLHDVVGFSASVGNPLFSDLDWNRGWNTASGGERQKAMLVKSLVRPAQLYILDEPFNHLDLRSRQTLSVHLNKLVRQQKQTSVLIITHDNAENGLQIDETIQLGPNP